MLKMIFMKYTSKSLIEVKKKLGHCSLRILYPPKLSPPNMPPKKPEHLTIESIWISPTVLFTALVIRNYSLQEQFDV
jgi:hypothetical protein